MRGLIEPGGQPSGWIAHSPPIEVESTTPTKSKAKSAVVKSAELAAEEYGTFMPFGRGPCVYAASSAG
jgi:hypothetical protein